mmetsp:Transcript_40691/g.85483  ORF Transcript_40691/g.85483 Transcript_40691/m.85483 type:complete len:235 (+) Transcript_40691:191-895(+)|eukprot:CAMPEP_0183730058 /NCGR_PEP_ID=MMETSP0737-20130205/31896_1 /TAXON_ID=385413 /ORGANISM="Thalassiosira miniscula, Strain CCMP1093" /LENGTH=234 /DNA_ID=CAMNT_0025962437 /DNA_START=147 /DNA_END=851 /DNA_ORIENTATION=-
MKVFASIVILASACSAFSTNQGPANNAATRRDFFSGVASAAVAAGVVVAQPPAAMAKSPAPLPPINGIYSDPKHPNGYRVVRAADKNNAVVTLQDEPKGPIITCTGKIKTSKKTGTTVTFDLSPKGGPKNILGTVDGDKIFFPDGNAWTKFPGVDGIYSDPNHPAGYRVVRLSGSKMNITLQDEPKGDVTELVGKKKAGGYVVDFSPKGGPKNLGVQIKDGQLVFPDGNAWTKF